MPMIKYAITEDKIKSRENRVLAQKPNLPRSYGGVSAFIASFDNYLNDQFGFRKNFISGANKVRYHLFNEITSKQITVGNNDFFYLNSHSIKTPNSLFKSICGVLSPPKKLQSEIKQTINHFIQYYQNLGYKTGFAIIPSKSKIYPENLPSPQVLWCHNKELTWLDKAFKNNDNRSIYYPYDLLIKWKDTLQVYLPKHFHWNGQTPYKVANDILFNLWQITSDFNVLPNKSIVDSDLNSHLQGLRFKEPSVSYDYSPYDITECRGKTCTKNLGAFYKLGNSFHFKRKAKTTSRRLLLLTDSFGADIAIHFIKGFDEVTMININNLKESEYKDFFKDFINSHNPTHLLYLIHDGGVIWRTLLLKQLLNNKFNNET